MPGRHMTSPCASACTRTFAPQLRYLAPKPKNEPDPAGERKSMHRSKQPIYRLRVVRLLVAAELRSARQDP